MGSLLQNLKQHLTCSICRDIYKEPKTISCLHTFCCECLSNHAKASLGEGKFRCPECQFQIDLPEEDSFKSLPSSLFHNSLLSLLAVRPNGDGINITCSQCRKTNSQMCYCFDCGRSMCPDCYNAHEMLKASFEGHKVTLVKEFKAEDYEALLKRQPFCSQQFHEKEITRFFCFSCQACVCQMCIFTPDHRNHEIDLLDKAAHEEKPNIMSGAEMIKEKISEFSEVIQQFEETISELERNVEIAKREVSQAAEQMITEIRKREREAIVSLETTRVTRLERMNSAMQEAQSLVKQMKQAVEFANNLAQRRSTSDIMLSKETLKQRFEKLRTVEAPKLNETPFVKFTAASVAGLKLGFIKTTDIADAKRSMLEGLDQSLQAGVEADFTLFPKTSEGKLSNQAELKDQVEFLIEPAKDVTNVMVSEKEDGNHQLKFTPTVQGAYSIEVNFKLSTCPFTMQVKERELAVIGELELKFLGKDVPKELNGIAVNTEGKIVVTDHSGHCAYVFNQEGNCLRKIGNKGSSSGQFEHPAGVTFLDDSKILIADKGNHRIQHINVQIGTVEKSFGKCGARNGQFDDPIDVTLDDEGRIVVTECINDRILVLSKEGETISIFGDNGPEKLNSPTSSIPYKNMFLVSDGQNHCVKVFDQSGTFLYKFGTKGNLDGQFNWPRGILVDKSSNLLVCDSNNNRVQQFSVDGRFTGKTITHLEDPAQIAAAQDGRILVTSGRDNKVYILK